MAQRVDILRRFVELAPSHWAETLDGWCSSQQLFSTSHYELHPQRTHRPKAAPLPLKAVFFQERNVAADPLQTPVTSPSPLEQLLLRYDDQGGIGAMETLAPFIGSLAISMLERDVNARNAMAYLAQHETTWSPQARAILAAEDPLTHLYRASDLWTFETAFSRLNREALQPLLNTLFCRQQQSLDKTQLFEQAGAIIWGPLHAARLLLKAKFDPNKNPAARRLRDEVMDPVIRELSCALERASAEEIVMHLKICLNFGKVIRSNSLRDNTVQALSGLGLDFFVQGIALGIHIPENLGFRDDFNKKDFYSLMRALLRFSYELRDRNRSDSFITVTWDRGQQALVIQDNGRGIIDADKIRLRHDKSDPNNNAASSNLEKARNLLRAMAWKTTIESVPREGTRLTVSPLLDDLTGEEVDSASQGISGPPRYGFAAQPVPENPDNDTLPGVPTMAIGANRAFGQKIVTPLMPFLMPTMKVR